MWFRVFGTADTPIDPAEVVEHLRLRGIDVEGHFGGDDQGWFKVDLVLAKDLTLHVERYLTEEEGIREELNAWAAFLESCAENHYVPRLMQQMVGTQQLFTFRVPRDRLEDEPVARLCRELCQYLCEKTKGVYQMDGQGFRSEERRVGKECRL